MLAYVRNATFVTSGTTSKGYSGSRRYEFVPHDNPESPAVLMGPAIIPDPADLPGKPPTFTVVEPNPAPSLANGCGRSALVFLDVNPTNIAVLYPVEAAASGKQCRTVLNVLVDKGGTASKVTIAETSGSPILDQAAVKAREGIWHYQTPPPECADQGVLLRTHTDWFFGPAHFRVMPGDPAYPAEAVADKLSGSGVVYIARSQDGELVSTRVFTSTNSPVLDAAMVKFAIAARFTPGTKEQHSSLTGSYTIEFAGDPDALRAAAAAPARRIAPPAPPPSAANDCGRSGDVYLAPVPGSHVLALIPRLTRLPLVPYRAQGALLMHVLVDRDGKAASVTVGDSSAPPEMERAVTSTVKENYRWAHRRRNAPPPA
jgi:TonB family protein